MILASIRPESFCYAVSLRALLVPCLLLAGLRYRGALSKPLLLGTGGVSGFLGGIVGVPGPPVILLYLASPKAAAKVRANILVYLFAFDIVLIALLALQNRLESVPVIIGLAALAGVVSAGIDLVFFDELMKTVPVDRSATFVSIAQSLQYLSSFVAPLIGTTLASLIGLSGALTVAAIVRFAGFLLFAFWKPERDAPSMVPAP